VNNELAPVDPISPPVAAPPPRSFARRHLMAVVAVVLLGGPAVGITLWTLAALKFSYSTGDRIGYVQKLSRRGWICRTWEGELAMSPVPGATPQIFTFTVPGGGIAKQIADLEGRKVALHYQEKRGLPSSCFGDTHYFVTEVRSLAP
jgi:hypothetical protein